MTIAISHSQFLVNSIFKNWLVWQFGNTVIPQEIKYIENDKMI